MRLVSLLALFAVSLALADPGRAARDPVKDGPGATVKITTPSDGDKYGKGASVGIISTAVVSPAQGSCWVVCEVSDAGGAIYEEWAYAYSPGETIYWPAVGPLAPGTYRVRVYPLVTQGSDHVIEFDVLNT